MTETEQTDALRAMLEAGRDIPPASPPPDDEGGGDGDDDRVPAQPFRLKDDCPVRPLGKMGETCAYLDELGQYVELKVRDHTRLNIEGMFGRVAGDYLPNNWPRYTKAGKNEKGEDIYNITGWRPELAATALLTAAAERGVWSPQDRVRGAGVWRDADGTLILHLGDKLLSVPGSGDGIDYEGRVGDRPEGALPWAQHKPGLVGAMVYPTASTLRMPALEPRPSAPHEKNPGQRLLNLFKTWSLRRPEIDAELLLGFVCAAMLGGALKVRPLIWVTGGYGTGKSSLQDAVKWLFGPAGMLTTSDPTPAGIRQTLGHASLPIGLDEAEATEDNSRMSAMVKLARDAATGSISVRGGQNHEAKSFTVRSCFLFSSILIPPLLPQDRSRMGILEMLPLKKDSTPPRINPAGMAKLGSQLLRRLVDQWHRADATIEAYRDSMRKLGLDARGQDVYGTLLACANLALYDETPVEDMLDGMRERLRPWILAEQDSNDGDSKSCLNHLLTYAVDSGGDSRRREPLGWWICRASGYQLPAQEKPNDEQMKAANRVLGTHGLAVVTKNNIGARSEWQYIAVANKHHGLLRIFDRTQWGGRPGADGVWRQSLSRLVRDRKQINFLQWIGGATGRCTLIDIELAWPKNETEPASAEEAAAPQDGDQARSVAPAPSTPERPEAGTAQAPQPAQEDTSGGGDPSAWDDEDPLA